VKVVDGRIYVQIKKEDAESIVAMQPPER